MTGGCIGPQCVVGLVQLGAVHILRNLGWGGGSSRFITILHGGGSPQIITILHRWGEGGLLLLQYYSLERKMEVILLFQL